MRTDIPFDEIMKDSKNWDDNMDIDAMNDNYNLLKSVVSKFYFREYPTMPKLFTLVFSQKVFAEALLYAIEQCRFKRLERVYFCEYTKEDKEKLAQMGIINPVPVLLDIAAVAFTKANDILFVCVFP